MKSTLLHDLDLTDDTIPCNRPGCTDGIYHWVSAWEGRSEGPCWRCNGTSRMKVEQLGVGYAIRYYAWKAARIPA